MVTVSHMVYNHMEQLLINSILATTLKMLIILNSLIGMHSTNTLRMRADMQQASNLPNNFTVSQILLSFPLLNRLSIRMKNRESQDGTILLNQVRSKLL